MTLDLILRQGIDRALTFDDDVAAPLCNDILVDFLTARGFVTDPRLAAAMRERRRDRFVPGVDLRAVYSDRAVNLLDDPCGWMMTSGSAPSVVAAMIEALDVPGNAPCRVLEIGTGSGYSAALLAGTSPHVEVVTVEILEEVREAARRRFTAEGIDRVEARSDGDDVFGNGPFDRIVATCAFEAIPDEWFTGLVDGGVVVVPVGSFVYRLRRSGDRLLGEPIMTAEFVVRREASDDADVVEPRTVSGPDGALIWWGDTTALDHVAGGHRSSQRVELPALSPSRLAAARILLDAAAPGPGFTFASPGEWGFGVTDAETRATCVCRVSGSFGFRHYPDAPVEAVVELHGDAHAAARLWDRLRPRFAADGPALGDLAVDVSASGTSSPGPSVTRGSHAWTYTVAESLAR